LKYTKRGVSQKLLHQLKYKNKPGLGKVLGRLYGKLLLERGYLDRWDGIIPVPLHSEKLRRRGYNQSECFAEGLSEVLSIPVLGAVRRNTNTTTQTSKSRLQRWENVSEVFDLVNVNFVSGKRILLVDDVMTTGATLAACARAIHSGRPAFIDLVVIAAGKN
jgi:ComF family protein